MSIVAGSSVWTTRRLRRHLARLGTRGRRSARRIGPGREGQLSTWAADTIWYRLNRVRTADGGPVYQRGGAYHLRGLPTLVDEHGAEQRVTL
jgi:hypothetical protein